LISRFSKSLSFTLSVLGNRSAAVGIGLNVCGSYRWLNSHWSPVDVGMGSWDQPLSTRKPGPATGCESVILERLTSVTTYITSMSPAQRHCSLQDSRNVRNHGREHEYGAGRRGLQRQSIIWTLVSSGTLTDILERWPSKAEDVR